MIHTYKLGGYNLVLDIASGSIHSVDEVAFDAIRMYESESRNDTAKYLKERYAGISDGDIAELFADIDRLVCQGKLFSPDTAAGAVKPKGRTALKALCLNVSHVCNMSCAYCFAGRGEYGGGEGLMDIETGKRAIDFLIRNSVGRKTLDVDFFGGEPLLNLGVVKGIVDYARKNEEASGKKFRFTFTTNGLLIDDDFINFANREMHNIVLSLDGRRETHDAMRKLPDGGGSYAEVVPKLKRAVEGRRGKGYYIRGTFTRFNLDFTNDILHMADLGFKELSMEPVVANAAEAHALKMEDLAELCRQYELLSIEMLRRRKEGNGFTFYHYILDLERGPCIQKRIAGCGVGTEYLAVTPRGELYPCHQFVGDKRFIMGDVWRGVSNERLRDEFGNCNIFSREDCRDCWARLYCSGGCAANAFNAAGSIGGVYKLGCELFKKRIECAIMLKVSESVKY